MYNLSVQWVGGGRGVWAGWGEVGGQNKEVRELESRERESNTHVFPVINHCAKYCKSSSGKMDLYKWTSY